MKLTYRVDNELTLRLVEPRHAEELYALIDANRQAILPWMQWAKDVTDADVIREHIIGWVKQTAESGCMSLGIELDDELVGMVFHVRPDNRSNQVEVGYWLAESARGRGVATRAVRALIDMTIRDLGFNRVNIRIEPRNKPSLALAKRLGLEPEGIARQSWKVGDEYWDATEFGVLADEWKPTSPSFALTHRIDPDLDLQLLEVRHTEALFKQIEANRDYLQKWLVWPTKVCSLGEAKEVRKCNLLAIANGDSLILGMVYKGQLVGTIGLNSIDPVTRSASLGYWLIESAQGQGVATRAASTMVNHAICDLGLHRLTIRVATGNAKSHTVAERLGFEREGLLREVELLNGQYVDHVQYAVLADEWKGGAT